MSTDSPAGKSQPSAGSLPLLHSSILEKPSPSQSTLAKSLDGLFAKKVHKSKSPSTNNSHPPCGVLGSLPMLHSVILSTPSPSQSKVANGLLGSAANTAHISIMPAIIASQSSSGLLGSVPLLHSVLLSAPPPSQSNIPNGLFGSAAKMAHISIVCPGGILQPSLGSLPALHS